MHTGKDFYKVILLWLTKDFAQQFPDVAVEMIQGQGYQVSPWVVIS